MRVKENNNYRDTTPLIADKVYREKKLACILNFYGYLNFKLASNCLFITLNEADFRILTL